MLIGNVAARVVALGCVLVTTLLLARHGGPQLVGVYALLHVLPGLLATVASCGLPVAVPYFLAGPRAVDRRVPATLIAIAAGGAAAGMALWVAAAPVAGPLLFGEIAGGLVFAAALAVATRMAVVTAKACSQGGGDLAGANRVIVLEELMFLPAFGVLAAAGAGGASAVVLGMLCADVATAVAAWRRLVRRGFLADARRPSARLAREVAGYGARAQLGGLLAQLNLRLDFVLLAALTSPAVLGVYAIASKFAELLRLVTMSLTYVLYPAYARAGRARAAAAARRLLPRAGLLSAGAAAALWVAAGPVITIVYGDAFETAVWPARIILLGLALEGAAAVVTAYLHGVGRPGLNSWAMAAGLAVTVALDIALIPRYGATGAAVASAAAYGTASLVLIWIFSRTGRTETGTILRAGTLESGGTMTLLARNGDGPERVLVVVAHPDDETLGAGGTIARLAREGSEVWVAVVCDGVTARHGEVERQRSCAERACEALGVAKVVFCDLPDQRLDSLSLLDVIAPIERCVAELRPHVVLTHFAEDVNQDHGVVFRATMVATRPTPGSSVRTVMCFETASSTEWAAPFSGSTFAPSVFVDIRTTLDTKVKAMSVYGDTHVCELKPYPHPRSLEAVEIYAKRHGIAVGLDAAEPFMLVRGLL